MPPVADLTVDSRRQAVLVVDDDDECRAMLAQALTLVGFAVRTAVDGYDALSKIDRDCPAVVVLDVNMPRVDGWAVCRALAASDATRSLPVVIVSGEARLHVETPNVVSLLRKPFDLDAVIGAVRSAARS